MMAQVIDPDPVYDGPMVTSGDHAADAIDRYREDAVKEPDSIRTTSGMGGGEGGGGN
jgi:cell division GTPase FtsZ